MFATAHKGQEAGELKKEDVISQLQLLTFWRSMLSPTSRFSRPRRVITGLEEGDRRLL